MSPSETSLLCVFQKGEVLLLLWRKPVLQIKCMWDLSELKLPCSQWLMRPFVFHSASSFCHDWGLFLVSLKGKKKRCPLCFWQLVYCYEPSFFHPADIFCNVILETDSLTWMHCYLFCWYETHLKAFSLFQALGFLWYSDDQNFSFASTCNEPYFFKKFLQCCHTTNK